MALFLTLTTLLTGAAASDDTGDDGAGLRPGAGTAYVSGVVRFSARVSSTYQPAGEAEPPMPLSEDPAARGLEGALVRLEREDADPKPRESNAVTKPPTPTRITQRDFRFVPQVLAVRAGQDVLIGNDDYENHSVRAIATNPRNEFNIVTVAGNEYTRRFELEDSAAPLRLVCDFHSSMEAWVYVLDHRRFAVTDTNGRFRIGPIEPGRYRLEIRHPALRMRADSQIEVVAGIEYTAKTTFGLKHRYYRDAPPVHVRAKDPEGRAVPLRPPR